MALAQQAPEIPPTPPSALAPENLARARPPAPFNLTGNWFIDNTPAVQGWLFGPASIPKLHARGAEAPRRLCEGGRRGGKVYRDDIGQCWPAGVPIIMTRVWPIAMIQLPTAIYMISEFMNSLRTVFLDGRSHTDPGHRRAHLQRRVDRPLGRRHAGGRDQELHRRRAPLGGSGRPASGELRIVERIRMINNGRTLESEMTLTDPKNWEGEWKGTRRWNRVNDIDIEEVECLPDLNEHLQSTSSKVHVR